MTYEMVHYRKDAAMWKKLGSVMGEVTPESFIAFTSMMGFKETECGSFWKQTAHDEAIEIIVVKEEMQ